MVRVRAARIHKDVNHWLPLSLLQAWSWILLHIHSPVLGLLFWRRWPGSCAHFSLSHGHTWLQGRWAVQPARWPPSQWEPRRHCCQEEEKKNRDWGILASSVFLPCCPSCWDVTWIVWSFFWPPQADLPTPSVPLHSSLSTLIQHFPKCLPSHVFTVSLPLSTGNILRIEMLPYSSFSTPQSLATVGHQQVHMRDNE